MSVRPSMARAQMYWLAAILAFVASAAAQQGAREPPLRWLAPNARTHQQAVVLMLAAQRFPHKKQDYATCPKIPHNSRFLLPAASQFPSAMCRALATAAPSPLACRWRASLWPSGATCMR